jgi:tetratricopeptide (TPR) repeat protein
MSQRNIQIIVIALSIGLFAWLYFGSSNRSADRSRVEKTRALKAESQPENEAEQIVATAKKNLEAAKLEEIETLELSLPLQLTDSLRAETFKALSKAWNEMEQFTVGGIYAQKVAKISNTAEAWSIVGTTFGIALKQATTPESRQFCINQSVEAFTKASELDPKEVQHKINLALTYVETEQPMQGIAMLRTLSEEFPENTSVLMALGQLAVRSGQYDKAIERYQQVARLEPNNLRGQYALAQVYQSVGKTAEAIAAYQKCLALSTDATVRSDIEQLIKKLKSN